MTTQTSTGTKRSGSTTAGSVTLALGVLFTAAVAYAYVLSLSAAFNPPIWVRVIGLVWLPIGFGGVPIAYNLARTGEGFMSGPYQRHGKPLESLSRAVRRISAADALLYCPVTRVNARTQGLEARSRTCRIRS